MRQAGPAEISSKAPTSISLHDDDDDDAPSDSCQSQQHCSHPPSFTPALSRQLDVGKLLVCVPSRRSSPSSSSSSQPRCPTPPEWKTF
jgi:hypothetical protein